jgi:hypothetical protein
MVLPSSVAKEIERFKKEYGSGWSRRLIQLMRQDLQREQALAELQGLVINIRDRNKLTEKDVYKRLK